MSDTDRHETAREREEEESRIFGGLSAKERRRALTRVTIRTVLTVAVLIAVYALVPPRDLADGNIGARLIIALVLFIAVLVFQFFAIMRDPTPELRAGAAMIVAVTLLVLMFSMTYAAMAVSNPDWFSQPVDKESAIYFTVTVLGTVGFGDITAVSRTARWVVTAQMILDLTLVVALGRVLVTAARAGRHRQRQQGAGSGGPQSGGDATS